MTNKPALEVTFRNATRDDTEAILGLVQSAYRGESSRTGWTTEADILDGQRIDVAGIEEVLDAEHSRVLLAFAGDRLLACCQLEPRANNTAYLGMFSVMPALQGQGVGRAVIVR